MRAVPRHGKKVCGRPCLVFVTAFCGAVCLASVVFLKRSPDAAAAAAGCVRIDLLDPGEVPVGRSMFFIETNRDAAAELTTRQACSVESAARANPDRLVFVLFLSPKLKCSNDITAIFSLLENYRNVRFRYINYLTYVHNTPVEDFIQSEIMEKGLWPVEQFSDLYRIVTLWKFGGIYMDLDVISLRQMPLIDFIGAEHPGNILASSVIGIQNKDIAKNAMYMFRDGWDGNVWNNNGPLLFTNLLKKICETDDIEFMYLGVVDCKNVTVYPPEVSSSINWDEWELFFDPTKIDLVESRTNQSMSIHFWNKLSKSTPVVLDNDQPYASIASKNCPKVFSTVLEHF